MFMIELQYKGDDEMKKVFLLVVIVYAILLTGCTGVNNDSPFDVNESYELKPIETVQRPVDNSLQDDNIVGVETESISVTEIDWQVLYESELYSILYRGVPDDMLFNMIGYPIGEDGTCNIGARTRYQYVVYYEEEYYDILEFHQKYNNLNCSFLEEIGIEYSVRVN